MKIFSALVVFAMVSAACSSSTTTSATNEVSTVCSKFVTCGVTDSNGAAYTQATCSAAFLGFVPPSGCVSAVSAATCADILATSGNSTALNTCFPPCTGTASSCAGDDVTECSNNVTVTLQCGAVCTRNSETYVGSCSATYQGQTSTSGQPVCWCK